MSIKTGSHAYESYSLEFTITTFASVHVSELVVRVNFKYNCCLFRPQTLPNLKLLIQLLKEFPSQMIKNLVHIRNLMGVCEGILGKL